MLKQIYLPFILALMVAIFGTAFFPSIRLFAFAPFLAIVLMRSSFLTSLWIAAGTGLLVDLLSSQMRFGAYSVIYCLTALLIYHQRRHFFADKPLALTLFTLIISLVAGSLELVFLHALDSRLPINWRLLITDLVGMSVLDALYAFLCFTCPMKVNEYLKRIGGLRHLLFKKDE
ncbi:MAG: hypothetical protein HYX48_04670 [Chlamydiales bacterium]|nr:hypothetical protein [Chlamydiales bacterium]